MEKSTKKNLGVSYTISLAFIILLALSSRIYISFMSGLPWFGDDVYNYIKMADAIVAGHPYSYFPNGLPMIIVVIKLFFNPKIVPTMLICLNIILSTITVWMTVEIIKKLTKNKLLALIGGFCIALYPNQINHVRQILTETPTTFLLTLGLLFFLRKRYFLSGLILFSATLFRSTLLPILPMLVIFGLFHPNTSSNKKIKTIHLLCGFGLGIALYSILILSNTVKPSSNLAETLLISISSYSQHLNFFAPVNFTLEEKQHPFHTYFEFMLNNPAEYTKQRLLSLQELWGWPSTSDPPRHQIAKILIAIHFPLLILAILGFVKRIRDFDVWVLFVPITVITLVHVATFSSPRYICTIEPCLVALAIIALSRGVDLSIFKFIPRSWAFIVRA